MEDSSSQQHRRTPPSPPAVVWSISWVCTLDLVGSKGLVQFHFFFYFFLYIYVFIFVCAYVLGHMCGGYRTMGKSCFSPSTMGF